MIQGGKLPLSLSIGQWSWPARPLHWLEPLRPGSEWPHLPALASGPALVHSTPTTATCPSQSAHTGQGSPRPASSKETQTQDKMEESIYSFVELLRVYYIFTVFKEYDNALGQYLFEGISLFAFRAFVFFKRTAKLELFFSMWLFCFSSNCICQTLRSLFNKVLTIIRSYLKGFMKNYVGLK